MAIHFVLAILTFTISPNLKAIELSSLCTAGRQDCTISTTQSKITNSSPFNTNEIKINAIIDTFINHSNITSQSNQTFTLDNTNFGKITHLINYGNISGGIRILGKDADMTITNYGAMRGVWTQYQPLTITLNNLGVLQTNQGIYVNTAGSNAAHFALESSQANIAIQNHLMVLRESQNDFNSFSGYTDKTNNKNSHLIIFYNNHTPTAQNVYFKDGDSKIWLDFGENFELGKEYAISKLVTDRDGASLTALNVDFSRLTTRSELYTLTQSGDNFIVNLADSKTAGYSTIGSLYKSNIRTMNNFYTMSNAMIYPHKFTKKRVVKKRRVIRRVKKISTLDSIESLESFAYKTDSNNKQQSANRRMSQTIPNQTNNYHFILTPFLNHNLFFESGKYHLSGFDYGFLTAFSGKLTQNNSLGAHFMMSYGTLGDSKDRDFNITNLNLNIGLNYKFDMIWDLYLKARGDFFYFLNQVKTLTMPNAIKPNTLGFGVSVAYGKDFNFGDNGVLGLEVGLDYKGLKTTTITTHNNGDSTINESFSKALYHLLYVDVGLNYTKYFNTSIGLWGLNANAGIKGNLTANALAKSKVILNNTHSINMTIDNDKILGYVNISGSYVLNTKDFDMEFSLAYYGNYGDRVMSNGGGMEWRTTW